MKTIKIQVIQHQASRKYIGEVWIDNRLEIQTVPLAAEIVAIRRLNLRIDEFNLISNKKLPHLPEIKGQSPMIVDLTKCKEKTVEAVEAVEAVEQPIPKRQSRKPFTPYGLNGYLVDKQGNIRLMLDRKANAHTIVLEPEMFNALAEMVRKTQAQAEQAA